MSSRLRVLHLYRPTLPSLRAQAIQVVHACHALAARGHAVTLLANRGEPNLADTAEILAFYGLSPVDGLDLRRAPTRHPGAAGLWARAEVLRWLAGPPGLILARDEQPPAAWVPMGRHRVVVEAHALESALREDPAAREAEARLARLAFAFTANCAGTLAAWETAHALPERRAVLHNATSPGRARGPGARLPVLRCAGSPHAYKGHAWLDAVAAALSVPLEIAGEVAREALPAGLRLAGPLPYPAVPDWLAAAGALLLPLADNRFGREMTSPLKLWDYLATAVPVVAPDLPTVREAAALVGAALHLHRPGDAADLARAAREALAAPHRAPALRTWDQRAAEWEALLA